MPAAAVQAEAAAKEKSLAARRRAAYKSASRKFLPKGEPVSTAVALASPHRIKQKRRRVRWRTSGRTVYAYVGDNPISNVDPLGLCDKKPNCNTVLPNGQTIGQVVQNSVATIQIAASFDPSGSSKLGAFLATVQSHGPIDFKNNMGPDPTGFLGAAGNFAYGAIASGIGYSQSFAELGAGAYALQAGKFNLLSSQ